MKRKYDIKITIPLTKNFDNISKRLYGGIDWYFKRKTGDGFITYYGKGLIQPVMIPVYLDPAIVEAVNRETPKIHDIMPRRSWDDNEVRMLTPKQAKTLWQKFMRFLGFK